MHYSGAAVQDGAYPCTLLVHGPDHWLLQFVTPIYKNWPKMTLTALAKASIINTEAKLRSRDKE